MFSYHQNTAAEDYMDPVEFHKTVVNADGNKLIELISSQNTPEEVKRGAEAIIHLPIAASLQSILMKFNSK